MEKKKFYITTPIYYPSADFHIGHCYTTIIADAIARYKRLTGYDVFFQTGTDEHGQKIEKKAMEAGVSPKEYVDPIIENGKDLWSKLNISYDYFIRTTDEDHVKRVQRIFKKMYDNGDIYKGEYKGLYCTPCESFWTESQLDENGMCPDCHREVHEVSEEAYFFRLSKYQDRLIQHIEEHPEFNQDKGYWGWAHVCTSKTGVITEALKKARLATTFSDGIYYVRVKEYKTSNLDLLEIGANAAAKFLTQELDQYFFVKIKID